MAGLGFVFGKGDVEAECAGVSGKGDWRSCATCKQQDKGSCREAAREASWLWDWGPK